MFRIAVIFLLLCRVAFGHVAMPGASATKVIYTRGLDLSGSYQGAGGIGGLLARTAAGGGSAFYHADAGGNITSLTDTNGVVVARYLYDPFGTVIGKWGALADANVMQFSSMPIHAKSGLSLYLYRAYDPSLQRWTQPDPIGEWGGINLYGFVGNSPMVFVDPWGESWLGDYMDWVGKGIYDTMMGDRPGQYDPNTYGAMRARMLGGIDRDNNLLRDSAGDFGELAGDLAEYYLLNKTGELALSGIGSAMCKLKRLKLPNAPGIPKKYETPGVNMMRPGAAKKTLPALDSTGKVHGELPRPKDLRNYSRDELQQLRDELEQSVQKRIEATDQMGRDKPHGQRQGAEQDLIKSIEKVLEDLK